MDLSTLKTDLYEHSQTHSDSKDLILLAVHNIESLEHQVSQLKAELRRRERQVLDI